MKSKLVQLALPAIALVCTLALPAASDAQFGRGGGGISIGRGGVTIGSGGNYGPGYGYGQGFGQGFGQGYGYGPGYGFGQGYGQGYGQGLNLNFGSGYGRGYGYGPYDNRSYGRPSYSYSQGYYSDNIAGSGQYGSGYQAFYPPEGNLQYGSAQQGNIQYGAQQGSTQQRDPSRAYIHVMVPANAEVMFEGVTTQQRGPERMFMSPPLESGSRYSYTITAKWMGSDGKEMTRTKKVSLEPGRTEHVHFIQQGESQFQQPGQRSDNEEQQLLQPGQQRSNQPGTQTDPLRTTPGTQPQQNNPNRQPGLNPANPGTGTTTNPVRQPAPPQSPENR